MHVREALAKALRATQAALADIIPILRIIAPSLVLALLGAVAIAGAGQSIEAVRVLAEDASNGHPQSLIAFVLAMTFCGLMAWYWARVLVYLRYLKPANESVAAMLARRNGPRIAGIVPPLACALAAYEAAGTAAPGNPNGDSALLWIFLGCLGIALALYLFFLFRHRILKGTSPQSTVDDRKKVRTLPGESRIILYATFGLWFALLLFVAATYGRAVGVMGPLGVLLVSIGTWIAALSALYYLGRIKNFPAVTTLAAIVFFSSLFNLNDNHVIRHSIDDARRAPQRYDSAFAKWLGNRADSAAHRSYPVFFVTTEGGGLRAAYFTSLVLSAIQDRCPAFAQHVFAISGVSGGSVGGGLFAASAAREARNAPDLHCTGPLTGAGHFQRQADSILQRDFLTPLFAQALFPDLLQRALPFRVPGFDRARALELGLETAWHDVTKSDELSGSFYGLWKQFATGATPALFLNTTSVETGARMVESNLHPVGKRFDHLISLADVNSKLDLPLSTAMALSARFPIVTPVGGVPVGEQGWFGGNVNRYTDGGYFDNSGASTIMELLSSLYPGEADSTVGRSHRIRFTPVVIRIGFEVKGGQRGDTTGQFTSTGLNEVLSPIRTLLNTRDARAATAVEQLRTAVDVLQDHHVPTELIEFELTQDKVPLVLGWLLSGQARAEMTAQFGPARKCPAVHPLDNACSYQRIVDLLAGSAPRRRARR